MSQAHSSVPVHVPQNRVIDFDIFSPPGVETSYFDAWLSLKQQSLPNIVWTTANGGHWLAIGGREVRQLWEDHTKLSSEVLAVTPGLGEVMKFIPLQLDPPQHKDYRSAVTKGFAYSFLATIKPRIREVAQQLIAGIKNQRQCEFMSEFAEILPVHIFLTLINVPTEDRVRLKKLGAQLTRPDGSMTVEQLVQAADDYLRPYIEERMSSPGEDLISRIISHPIQGRAWNVDEVTRLSRNLLFGGLDTVVAMIGNAVVYLAENPKLQQQLRDNPAWIPDAADECIRRFPTVSVSRNVVEDVEIDGVVLKAGDVVYLPSIFHNLDDSCFDSPMQFQPQRKLPPTEHTTMGVGVHRCVGAALARTELIIFLEEWLSAIPEFRVNEQDQVVMRGGNVGTLVNVPLVW